MIRAALLLACVLSTPALAQTFDTTAPTEQRLGPVGQVDNPNEGSATRDSPDATAPAVTTPAPQGPRGKVIPPKEVKAQTPRSPPKMGFAEFIVTHVLMGVMTGAVVVLGVALLAALPFLLLPLPQADALQPIAENFPDAWRRGAGLLIAAGILPGVLMAIVGGIAVTAISAIRNRDAVTERK